MYDNVLEIVSEYDQEIPQSQIADNPVAPRGRAAQSFKVRVKVKVLALCYTLFHDLLNCAVSSNTVTGYTL